jgi:ketopantoate reductase
MLNDFDQSTIANMTAALDFVCKKISADRDSNELRKRIADELMRCARVGRHTLVDLERAGMKVLEETAKPKPGLFAWWRHAFRQ